MSIFVRINGLIRIAEKREAKGGEIDKIVGRQVCRNLKMAKKIIKEEICICQQCVDYIPPEEAEKAGYISEMYGEPVGYCPKHKRAAINTDFCSWGQKKC